MAGSASSWHKIPAGPLAGEAVFIPSALKGPLSDEQIEQQLAGGYGGWLNELPPGPLHPHIKAVPAVDPASFKPNILDVPLLIVQADGDHALKTGKQMGALAVVESPLGHAIVHVPTGKALVYVSAALPGKPKPTPQSEQQALLMMVSFNSLYGSWAQAEPEQLDPKARQLLALAEEVASGGTFKPSKWVTGKGATKKKQSAPNDADYAAMLAEPSPTPPVTAGAASAPEEEPLASPPISLDEEEATDGGGAPAGSWMQTIQVMANVYDEAKKQPVLAEVSGPLAVHPDVGGHGWTIAHIASGYPVAVGFKTKKDAVEALILAEDSDVDWNYSDKKSLMANKANFDKAATLGKKLRSLAEASSKPKPVKVEPPPWAPKGGVKSFPTLAEHEQAIQAAYGAGEGFVRGTSLTKTTQKAIASYQNGGYGAINQALWGKGSGDDGTKATVMKQIEQLDGAMSLSQVPFNMVVVRSQGQASPLYQQMSVLEVGDIYETPAFDSASINHNNTWGGGQVRVHYRLPKGAKAIFMNALKHSPNAPGYQSKHPGEHECLLARNSHWKLVGKEVDDQGRIQVTVELVEQIKPQKGAAE